MTVEIVKTAPETKTATTTAGTTAAKTGASAAAREAAAKRKAAQKAAQKKAALKKAAARKVSRAALQRAKALRAVRIARQQIGDPYRYGATGPGAFDCSGLVQYAWRKAGVRLPRTTWSIKSAVRKKVSWGSFKPGDLIFTSGGGHVGMYVGDGKMVHAPRTGTRVRIDKLDAYRRSSFVGAVRPGA